MTSRLLPADGLRVWRVTSPAGVRYVRPRLGGAQLELETGAEAESPPSMDADRFAAEAPGRLWELWALAEAQAPRWGWSLLRIGPSAGDPVGWTLAIDPPFGGVQMYTWERTAGGRMRPLCSVELIAAAAARLAGP